VKAEKTRPIASGAIFPAPCGWNVAGLADPHDGGRGPDIP
jgi:hypothetical protein